jgi:hypothetical protein
MGVTGKKLNPVKLKPASSWQDCFHAVLQETGESRYLTAFELRWVEFARTLGASPAATVKTLLAAR